MGQPIDDVHERNVTREPVVIRGHASSGDGGRARTGPSCDRIKFAAVR